MSIYVTRHARKRIKERCGIGKGKAERYAELAVERGYDASRLKGELRRWVDSRADPDKRCVVWGDKLFVLAGRRSLVTVLQIPASITKNMHRMVAA